MKDKIPMQVRPSQAIRVAIEALKVEMTMKGYKPRERWKKPTYFAVSHDSFESLGRICAGNHEHTHVRGSMRFNNRRVNRSKLAGRYPFPLCVAYARCVKHIMSHDQTSA